MFGGDYKFGKLAVYPNISLKSQIRIIWAHEKNSLEPTTRFRAQQKQVGLSLGSKFH